MGRLQAILNEGSARRLHNPHREAVPVVVACSVQCINPISLNCLRKCFHVFGHPARFHGGLVWFELACGVFCVRARVCVCVCECARGGKGRAKFWRVVTASKSHVRL